MGMMTRRNVKARAVKPAPPTEAVIVDAPKDDSALTAEAVQAMPYFSLKSEAKKRGIEAEGKKADTLREELIAAL